MAADLRPEEDERLDSTLQSIQRDINCLSDDNRGTRKRALEKIKKEVFSKKPQLSAHHMQIIFDNLLKAVLKLFSDPVEKCRELSVQLVQQFSDKVLNLSAFLPYIIPTVVQRLAQPEITEPCEEVRLQLQEFLSQVVGICKESLNVYCDDMIKILQRTLTDPFHDVRREGCKCTQALAKVIPREFYMQASSLIKPLLMSLSHQHSKVRVVVLQTIGVVIQHGEGKTMDEVVSHIAQRTFDSSPTVRAMVTTVVGDWLLDFRDRYSFFHKLLPLLLSGLSDEVVDIQNQSREYMAKVGNQFAEENEEDLKDKINFEVPLAHKIYKDTPRPSLGCRVLVQRNVSKILPAALRDMQDWTADTRVKSAQLVYHLLFYAEDYATQHMEILLNGLYKGCQDEQPQVVERAMASAELVGVFVSPLVFCKLALAHLKTTSSSSSAGCASVLMVLGGLIRGSRSDEIKPCLKAICESISSPDVCCSEFAICQQQLLSVISAIIEQACEDCEQYSLILFAVTLHVMALQKDATIAKGVQDILEKLAVTQGLDSVEKLYEKHTKDVLLQLKLTHESWTNHSPERMLFDALLLHAGAIIGALLDDIIPIFATCLQTKRDPELRLKFFTLLSKLLVNSKHSLDSQSNFGKYSVKVMKDILPNLVWQAGRTASAIRTAGMSCLWAVLHSELVTSDDVLTVINDLLTQMTSCMDDHNQTTRLISCRVLEKIFTICQGKIDCDLLHNMYPELLKRMDDSSDEVRLMVIKTFKVYFSSFPSHYDKQLYKLHLEAMYKGLLVHLDDPSPDIQEGVLDVLKEGGKVQPAQLKEQVDAVRHKHRVARYCNELLQHIQDLHVGGS